MKTRINRLYGRCAVSAFILVLVISLNAYDFTLGGVRNAAMGGTGIASANDASATVWNPALLSCITKYQFASDSRKYSIQLDNDELSENHAYLAIPLSQEIGTIGISASTAGSRLYDETSFALSIGSGALSERVFNRTGKLMAGMSVKGYMTSFDDADYINPEGEASVFKESKSAFDADLGLLYRLSDNLQFGVAVQRVLTADMAIEKDVEDRLPRIYRAGAGYELGNLKLTADVSMEDGEQSSQTLFAAGAEFQPVENLFIRGGVNNTDITAGIGIDIYHVDWLDGFAASIDGMADVMSLNIGVDYAFQTPFMDNELESDFGNHFFGLRISYGNQAVCDDELDDIFPDQYSSGLDPDSLYYARVKADTVYKEVTRFDTLRIIERVADEDIINERLTLEANRIKLEQVKDINRASVFLIRSLEYFYAEQYTRAIDMCEQAISIAPGLSMSYLRIASIYYHLNEEELALEYLNQGLRIDPDNSELKKLKDKIQNQ